MCWDRDWDGHESKMADNEKKEAVASRFPAFDVRSVCLSVVLYDPTIQTMPGHFQIQIDSLSNFSRRCEKTRLSILNSLLPNACQTREIPVKPQKTMVAAGITLAEMSAKVN